MTSILYLVVGGDQAKVRLTDIDEPGTNLSAAESRAKVRRLSEM
jgi:hypothetical protein